MPAKRFDQYTTADRKEIARRIDHFLKSSSIPRKQFWQDAKIGKGTSEKLFIGQFKEAALIKAEAWAKRSFRDDLVFIDPEEQTALASLGGYRKSTKIPYIGEFLVARPSFEHPDAIHLSKVRIIWDAQVPGLVLIADENTFHVKIPEPTAHIYVFSPQLHPTLLITLSRLSQNSVMRGAVLAMTEVAGDAYAPCASPVYMCKVGSSACSEEEAKVCNGGAVLLRPTAGIYERWATELKSVKDRQYAIFYGV